MSIYIKPPEPGRQKLSPFALFFYALLLPAGIAYFIVSGNEFRQFATIISLVVGAIIFARPILGLMLFVALVYTRPEDLVEEIQGMRLSLIISLVTLVALLFQKLLDRQKITRNSLNLMIIGFGVSATISAMTVGLGSMAVQEVSKLVLLPILILNIITDSKRYRQLVTVLLGLTCYLAGYAQYLYISGGALLQGEDLRSQGTGIFGDPNDLAATIVVGVSLALFRARQAKGWRRALYILMTLFFVYASVMTQSRGGFLALGAAFVGFIIFSNFKKSVKIGSFVMLAVMFLLASGRMANFDAADESANSRFWFWSNGIEHFIQTPIIGTGWRSFTDINGGMTAHNSFVLCFTELGLVGYFFWMACIYLGFTTPPVLRNVFRDEESRYDIMGARVALASFLVAVFWISRTYVPVAYIFISLPVVMMNCYAKDTKVTLPNNINGKQALRVLGICLASIVFIYMMALRLR